jgi:FdhD protein
MNRSPGAGSAQVAVRRVGNAEPREHDHVVVEEPLLIQLAWPGGSQAISVTMRTPGADAELALGFLFGEGIVLADAEIRNVNVDVDGAAGNSVTVELVSAPTQDLSTAERNFYMTSSCGVCGKASLDAVRTRASFDLTEVPFSVSAKVLQHLPTQLMARQALFAGTGSIHAAALFSTDGLDGAVFEDVGRHNALDKLIGNAFTHGDLPLAAKGIVVSGRASFELVQKACMAGSPMLAAVGAPSSLAVELAWESGMTLVGFVKADRFNVYSVPARVVALN